MKRTLLLFAIYFSAISCAWMLENNDNPYDFTVAKPALKDIAGSYKLTDASMKRLNIPESVAGTIVIELNADKTFRFKNIPENQVFTDIENFKTNSENGRWNLGFDGQSWVLQLTIVRKYDGVSEHISGQYRLNKNKPPYQVLKMTGDDNWEALEFEKK